MEKLSALCCCNVHILVHLIISTLCNDTWKRVGLALHVLYHRWLCFPSTCIDGKGLTTPIELTAVCTACYDAVLF